MYVLVLAVLNIEIERGDGADREFHVPLALFQLVKDCCFPCGIKSSD